MQKMQEELATNENERQRQRGRENNINAEENEENAAPGDQEQPIIPRIDPMLPQQNANLKSKKYTQYKYICIYQNIYYKA